MSLLTHYEWEEGEDCVDDDPITEKWSEEHIEANDKETEDHHAHHLQPMSEWVSVCLWEREREPVLEL